LSENSEIKFGLPSIIIPGEILFNPFISQSCKILFGYIVNLSKTNRGCWATNAMLGEYINCTPQSTSSMISILEKMGYLTVKRVCRKDGSEERQIFESNTYQLKYRFLVESFHDYQSLSIDFSLDEFLSIMIACNLPDLIEITCDDNPNQEERGLSLGITGVIRGVKRNTREKYYKKISKLVSKETISDSHESLRVETKVETKVKRTRKAPKEKPKPIPQRKKIYITERWKKSAIDSWNKISGTSSHQDLTTKTAEKINLYFDYLTAGIFWDRCTLSEKFIKNNKVPFKKNWSLHQKISPTEILSVIKNYEQLWKEGYWPQDKKHLPKSLSDFLFNPKTGSSFFLMLYYNKDVSKPLSEKNSFKYESPYIRHFSWMSMNGSSDDISRSLDRLVKWVGYKFDYENTKAGYYFKSDTGKAFDPFCELYSEWLQDCPWDWDWLSKNTKHVFNHWGDVFVEFLQHVDNKYGIEPITRG
jgi:hypothetical protein